MNQSSFRSSNVSLKSNIQSQGLRNSSQTTGYVSSSRVLSSCRVLSSSKMPTLISPRPQQLPSFRSSKPILPPRPNAKATNNLVPVEEVYCVVCKRPFGQRELKSHVIIHKRQPEPIAHLTLSKSSKCYHQTTHNMNRLGHQVLRLTLDTPLNEIVIPPEPMEVFVPSNIRDLSRGEGPSYEEQYLNPEYIADRHDLKSLRRLLSATSFNSQRASRAEMEWPKDFSKTNHTSLRSSGQSLLKGHLNNASS